MYLWELDAAGALLFRWQNQGVLGEKISDCVWHAGPAAERVVVGGFTSLHVDKRQTLSFFSNQQGGFRVRCPTNGGNLVPDFVSALQRWRGSGNGEETRVLQCPLCGTSHRLESLDFSPPARFALGAVVLRDAGGAELTEWARRDLMTLLGELAVVACRVS